MLLAVFGAGAVVGGGCDAVDGDGCDGHLGHHLGMALLTPMLKAVGTTIFVILTVMVFAMTAFVLRMLVPMLMGGHSQLLPNASVAFHRHQLIYLEVHGEL